MIAWKKHLLFAFLMVLLWLPMAQQRWILVDEWPLKGHAEPIPKAVFTLEGLVSGEFTKAFENKLPDHVGFRGHLVRLRNQFYYTLFRIAKANSVVVGKDEVLLDGKYIDAYYGADFAGKDFHLEKMLMWKELQDTLLKHGTHAVLVFAPGKASFFPDDIPDHLVRAKASVTNYAYLKHLSDSLGVTTVDLKAHFHAMADTSKYPLFTRGGIHWSEYGATLAQVQLGKELGALLDCPLDSISLRIELDSNPRGTDNDVELGMNLLFKLPQDTLAYAIPTYSKTGHAPTLLAIGDSYYWNLFLNGFRDRLCRHGGFWYYFREMHPAEVFGHKTNEQINLRNEVLKNEVLMLLMTEPQLPRFGWGSIETLHGVFCEKKEN
jgi:hypothetical protein